MKKIIAFLMLVIGAFSVSIPANAGKSEEKKPVQFDPINVGENSGKPQKPLYCPVSGYIENECLTLFCTSNDEAEIIIVDETGTIVYHELAVIYGEYCIFLEKDVNYSSIYITIGSHTFTAEL